jgi:hypothetical protein
MTFRIGSPKFCAIGLTVEVGIGVFVRVGVIVGLGGMDVTVDIGTAVSVGTILSTCPQEAKIKATSKTMTTMFLFFIDTFVVHGASQRLALLAVGGSGDSLSKWKKLKARKLPKNAPRTHRQVHAMLGAFS